MRYLALLLLAPLLLVLAGLYWICPLGRRSTWPRRLFDLAVLLIAVVLGVHLTLLGFDIAPSQTAGTPGLADGGIWKQVLPALCGYGVFVAVLALGLLGRFLLFRPARVG